MAKGGAKKANQMIERSNQSFQNLGDINRGRGEEAYGYGTGIRDYVTEKYKNLLGGLEAGAGVGGGGGGAVETSPYMADWETIRRLGATSEDQANTLRGYGIPREWAKTGGYTPQEMTNYRLRTTASVPGFYDAMRRNLQQRQAVSGGYGPGFDASNIALAREQARAGAAASLESEGRLQEDIRANKKWASTTGSDMEARIFGNQTAALEKLEAMRKEAIARRDAGAARAIASEQENLRNQMGILNELRQLRGETGAETDYDKLALAGYGGGLQAGQAYSAANPNMSIFDRIAQLGGAAAGAITPFTGIFGGKKKKKTTETVEV